MPRSTKHKIDPDVARHRARVANATLRGDEEAAEEAKAEMDLALRLSRAEEHIRALVDGLPAPSAEQCERLASLLRPM